MIATEAPAASKLLKGASTVDPDIRGEPGVGTCCVYFHSDRPPPVTEPVLCLDGDGDKLVNNCCFPSSVAANYAPPGKTLVSASTVGTQDDLTDDALVEVCTRACLDVYSWPACPCVPLFKRLALGAAMFGGIFLHNPTQRGIVFLCLGVLYAPFCMVDRNDGAWVRRFQLD